MKQPKRKYLSYAKWGYIFIIPFFLSFFIFSLIPLVDTIRYSFYEYYRSGIKEIGPRFISHHITTIITHSMFFVNYIKHSFRKNKCSATIDIGQN